MNGNVKEGDTGSFSNVSRPQTTASNVYGVAFKHMNLTYIYRERPGHSGKVVLYSFANGLYHDRVGNLDRRERGVRLGTFKQPKDVKENRDVNQTDHARYSENEYEEAFHLFAVR